MGRALGVGGLVLAGAVAALAASCGGGHSDDAASPTGTARAHLAVSSNIFAEGGDIPAAYGCDGEAISPDVNWARPPAGTQSFALIMLDPDANDFVHWLVYGIPPNAVGIPPGVTNEPQLANGSRQGRNGFGETGYGPPCPPRGSEHTYQFFVYALDSEVTLDSGARLGDVNAAIAGHVLAEGMATGRFGR